MKVTENWLKERINILGPPKEWTSKLTRAGLEVESYSNIGDHFSHICVGLVTAIKPHPNADRLKVCTVCIDGDTDLTIVCGAANVRENLTVIVAKEGACLPNNIQIKRTDIRGVSSYGMLCSADELGLTQSSLAEIPGIAELPHDATIGMPISEYLGLPDCVIDINITPNRGDCLSVSGLARELAAITNWSLAPLYSKEIPATILDSLSVELQASQACPRYLGRVIKDINPNAITPIYIQERLKRSQMRPIHPIVDIMNYVMLESGQPLHAFDLASIGKTIQVRYSRAGENMTLLDGQTITLPKDALVIADKKNPLALAGIMGGENSAVSPTTTDIFIESAFFTPSAIATTLRALHLQSDAAYRFERGVDPQLALQAMHQASELVLTICGGKIGPITEKTAPLYLPKPKTILLRAARIERILGLKVVQSSDVTQKDSITDSKVENILHRLNLFTTADPQGWLVKVPTYRFDLQKEIDLIEEVARLYGYTHIPSQIMTAPMRMQKITETQLTSKRLREYWVDQGYQETIHYSFIDPKLACLLDDHPPLILRNPISADLSVMRTTLWGGLLQSAIFNLNRQQSGVRLFEIGTCFLPTLPQDTDRHQKKQTLKGERDITQDRKITEITKLAGIAVGSMTGAQWGISERPLDFFDVKSLITNCLKLTHASEFTFAPSHHPALHPGRCAMILRADKPIGLLGELHPSLQQSLDISLKTYLFELTLDAMFSVKLPTYIASSKYPSIKRDLAFVVPNVISYHQIFVAIQQAAASKNSNSPECNLLAELQLFDVYTGKEIGEQHKSIALSLTFQLHSRTLTDEEVAQAIQRIITELGNRFGARLRQ